MRIQRNVTGIAVWLAFLSWMHLVAGMVSPSEVVAQNKVPWHVAQRVASAKIWQISDIISKATALNPDASAEIVAQSIKVRREATDTIIGAAIQAVPWEASKITAGAILVMSESQALKPPGTQPGTQTVSASVDGEEQLNYITIEQAVANFVSNPFAPNAAGQFTEDLTQAINELLVSVISPSL